MHRGQGEHVGGVARGQRGVIALEREQLEIERPDRLEQRRPRPAEDVLGKIGDQPGPANAHEHEADRARDQSIGGGVPEACVALAKDERERDGRPGRDQHPVRPAHIGDPAEEFLNVGLERVRLLIQERIDQQEAHGEQRHRDHQLVEQAQILEARGHARSPRQTLRDARAAKRGRTVKLPWPGSGPSCRAR